MAEPQHQTTGPDYGIEVCRHCDPVHPEHVGPEVESRCPECGGPLFGLLGTEVVDTVSEPRTTQYEVLDPIQDGEAELQASFTPNNGIRITIRDADLDPNLAVFDFTEEQAKLIGAKLVEWAERGH